VGSAVKVFVCCLLFFFWGGGYVFILNLLNFVQKPLWCTNYSTYSCDDREYFFLGEFPYLTCAESLIYEVRVRQKINIWLVEYL
jgi:two pore calcium channel protein